MRDPFGPDKEDISLSGLKGRKTEFSLSLGVKRK